MPATRATTARRSTPRPAFSEAINRLEFAATRAARAAPGISEAADSGRGERRLLTRAACPKTTIRSATAATTSQKRREGTSGTTFQLSYHPRRHSHGQAFIGDILRYHRSRTRGRSLAHPHGGHQQGVAPDERLVADLGPVLRAIATEIAGDRAGADVDALSDRAVTQVGEVTHLGTGAQGAVLDLTEVAHMNALHQMRARPKMRERPNVGALLYDRALHHRGDDPAMVSHPGISHDGVRADRAVAADARRSPPMRAGKQGWVRTDLHLRPAVGGRRIGPRDSGQHPLLIHPAAHRRLSLGEMRERVHSDQLVGVNHLQPRHLTPLAGCSLDEVGEVILALRRYRQLRQVDPQPVAPEAVDAGVVLEDRTLRRSGVRLFNDALDPTARTANHPAKAPRGLSRVGKQGQRPARGGLQFNQAAQRLDP